VKERGVTESANHEEAKVFSEEYVRTLRDENARRRLAEKNAKEELARVREALGIGNDETADATKEAGRMRARSEADRETAKEALMRAEFAKVSGELELVDADAAWRLADMNAVRVELESRKVEGLREVLETLVREKPYLAGRASRGGSAGGGTPRSPGKAESEETGLSGRIRKQFQKRLPAGLSVPGASLGDLRITR
jgi:hypothetical protein